MLKPTLLTRSYTVDKLSCDFFLLRCPDAYAQAIAFRKDHNLPLPLSALDFSVKIFKEYDAIMFISYFSRIACHVNHLEFIEKCKECIVENPMYEEKLAAILAYF
jgi:hypothetical protein